MITLHPNGNLFHKRGFFSADASLSPETARQDTMAWKILHAHSISPDPAHLQDSL